MTEYFAAARARVRERERAGKLLELRDAWLCQGIAKHDRAHVHVSRSMVVSRYHFNDTIARVEFLDFPICEQYGYITKTYLLISITFIRNVLIALRL
jgi:hypothetical protein